MADKFEIPIDITVKKEADVGKIGEKIATQIKKSLSAIGLGGGKTGGAAQGAAGFLGMTRGLKGIATKLGVIGVAIGAAVGLLAKSSPYLKGILDMFGRAFMIFFRPFGDFLATLLRPLAILMMKMAVAFLKFTRPITGKVREAVEGAPKIPKTGMTLPDIGIEIANWALKVGAAFGQVIFEIGKGAFNLGAKIGQWLYDQVIVPVADFISSQIFKAFDWVNDVGTKIWDILKSPFEDLADLIQKMVDKIKAIFGGGEDRGGGTTGFLSRGILPSGSILPSNAEETKNIIDTIAPIVKKGFFATVKGIVKRGLVNLLPILGGFQAGTSSVPETGVYQLHRGEQVIPRSKAGEGNRSVIFRPTFEISGNISSDIDMDSIVRRAGRMTEMDLKQRGII